jgi:medium-chain acyl-[acyl-carrier-protein] hydrolase
MGKIKLFCVPYAGGSATIYNGWKKYLDEAIEVCPLELTGRGKRYQVPLHNSIENIVNDLFYLLNKDELANSQYAFFGHGLGSLIIYELCYKIIESDYPCPIHLFVSGKNAPHLGENMIFHQLPDEEFKEQISKLGGTPKELFEHQGLWDIFVPILRADYQALETYVFPERRNKLDCNITVFYGQGDTTTQGGDVNGWRMHSLKECQIYSFEGRHFFINELTMDITKIINRTLTGYLSLVV